MCSTYVCIYPFDWGPKRCSVVCDRNSATRKTAGTAGKPARQQTPLCDIQMVVILPLANISIPCRYPTIENLRDLDFDLSRSVMLNLTMPLDSPYRVS